MKEDSLKNISISLDLINEICKYLDDCTLTFPSAEISPDLSEFTKQESDMPEFDFEWIDQRSNGISDDSFCGRIAFLINKELDAYLVIQYFTK